MELVLADGSLLRLTPDDPQFVSTQAIDHCFACMGLCLTGCLWLQAGAVTSCGCLGVVTQLTVQLVDDYDVKELKYFDIPCEHFIEHIYDMLGACTSFNANPCWSADTVMVTSLQTL